MDVVNFEGRYRLLFRSKKTAFSAVFDPWFSRGTFGQMPRQGLGESTRDDGSTGVTPPPLSEDFFKVAGRSGCTKKNIRTSVDWIPTANRSVT